MIRITQFLRRCSTSSLFISDSLSATTRPILKPEPNISGWLNNKEKFETDLKARGHEDFDVAEFQQLVQLLNDLQTTRNNLEARRIEIADYIKQLKKNKTSDTKDEVEKYKLQGKLVKNELKTLMPPFWEVEEKVMLKALSLPNRLHSNTPLTDAKILFEEKSNALIKQSQSHLEIGQLKGLIEYRNPYTVYLIDEAAQFEFSLQHFFLKRFKEKDFHCIIPSDFVTQVIVEGGAVNDAEIFSLRRPLGLYLAGGGSFLPIYALYCKQTVNSDNLPLKHIHFGRRYGPPNKEPGLYGSCQHNTVNFLTVCESIDSLNEQLEETTEFLKILYKELNLRFRIVLMPACFLKRWESLKISFQMFSPFLGKFVEVGGVSLSETFVSERLLIKHSSHKGMCFILSGTAVDITSVIAVVLEQGLDLADFVTKYKF